MSCQWQLQAIVDGEPFLDDTFPLEQRPSENDIGFELNMLVDLALLFPLVRYNSPPAEERARLALPRLTTNYQRDRRYDQGQDSTLILQSNGRLPSGVSWRPRGRADCRRCRPAPKPRRAATRGGHR